LQIALPLPILENIIFTFQVNNEKVDSNLQSIPFTFYKLSDGRFKVCTKFTQTSETELDFNNFLSCNLGGKCSGAPETR
jgi:hypothetical protein